MAKLQKVYDFLDKAGVFFLATEDGAQPRCRPLGFKMMVNGQIYFGVGTHKNVCKQMLVNNKVELCACVGQEFLRYRGTAVFDRDRILEEMAFDVMPDLRKIYSEESGLKLGIFHIAKGAAEFCNIMGEVQESIKV